MADKTTKEKAIYIGAPACFALEMALQHVVEAFGGFSTGVGCYIVGSVLDKADWRDVDVRLIMPDETFNQEFPEAGSQWEHNAKWLLLTVAISDWLSKQTGLPIDFQFQPQTHANERFSGNRAAIGFKIKKAGTNDAQ